MASRPNPLSGLATSNTSVVSSNAPSAGNSPSAAAALRSVGSHHAKKSALESPTQQRGSGTASHSITSGGSEGGKGTVGRRVGLDGQPIEDAVDPMSDTATSGGGGFAHFAAAPAGPSPPFQPLEVPTSSSSAVVNHYRDAAATSSSSSASAPRAADNNNTCNTADSLRALNSSAARRATGGQGQGQGRHRAPSLGVEHCASSACMQPFSSGGVGAELSMPPALPAYDAPTPATSMGSSSGPMLGAAGGQHLGGGGTSETMDGFTLPSGGLAGLGRYGTALLASTSSNALTAPLLPDVSPPEQQPGGAGASRVGTSNHHEAEGGHCSNTSGGNLFSFASPSHAAHRQFSLSGGRALSTGSLFGLSGGFGGVGGASSNGGGSTVNPRHYLTSYQPLHSVDGGYANETALSADAAAVRARRAASGRNYSYPFASVAAQHSSEGVMANSSSQLPFLRHSYSKSSFSRQPSFRRNPLPHQQGASRGAAHSHSHWSPTHLMASSHMSPSSSPVSFRGGPPGGVGNSRAASAFGPATNQHGRVYNNNIATGDVAGGVSSPAHHHHHLTSPTSTVPGQGVYGGMSSSNKLDVVALAMRGANGPYHQGAGGTASSLALASPSPAGSDGHRGRMGSSAAHSATMPHSGRHPDCSPSNAATSGGGASQLREREVSFASKVHVVEGRSDHLGEEGEDEGTGGYQEGYDEDDPYGPRVRTSDIFTMNPRRNSARHRVGGAQQHAAGHETPYDHDTPDNATANVSNDDNLLGFPQSVWDAVRHRPSMMLTVFVHDLYQVLGQRRQQEAYAASLQEQQQQQRYGDAAAYDDGEGEDGSVLGGSAAMLGTPRQGGHSASGEQQQQSHLPPPSVVTAAVGAGATSRVVPPPRPSFDDDDEDFYSGNPMRDDSGAAPSGGAAAHPNGGGDYGYYTSTANVSHSYSSQHSPSRQQGAGDYGSISPHHPHSHSGGSQHQTASGGGGGVGGGGGTASLQQILGSCFTSSQRILTEPSGPLVTCTHSDGVTRCVDNEEGNLVIYVGMVLLGWLEVVSELGSGSFGQVVLCKDLRTVANVDALYQRERDYKYYYTAPAFCDVEQSQGTLVAVKVIGSNETCEAQSYVEAQIMQELMAEEEAAEAVEGQGQGDPRKGFLCRILASGATYGHHCIAMERYACNLYEYLVSNSMDGLPISVVRAMAHQSLAALAVVHDKGYVHCDIKPENVMVKMDTQHCNTILMTRPSSCGDGPSLSSSVMAGGSRRRRPQQLDGTSSMMPDVPDAVSEGRSSGARSHSGDGDGSDDEDDDEQSRFPPVEIALIDFSSSCEAENTTFYEYIQSRYYRAPEAIIAAPYSKPMDVWSLGCVLAEMLIGRPLLPGANNFHQLNRIVEMFGPLPASLLREGVNTAAYYHCPPLQYNAPQYPQGSTEGGDYYYGQQILGGDGSAHMRDGVGVGGDGSNPSTFYDVQRGVGYDHHHDQVLGIGEDGDPTSCPDDGCGYDPSHPGLQTLPPHSTMQDLVGGGGDADADAADGANTTNPHGNAHTVLTMASHTEIYALRGSADGHQNTSSMHAAAAANANNNAKPHGGGIHDAEIDGGGASTTGVYIGPGQSPMLMGASSSTPYAYAAPTATDVSPSDALSGEGHHAAPSPIPPLVGSVHRLSIGLGEDGDAVAGGMPRRTSGSSPEPSTSEGSSGATNRAVNGGPPPPASGRATAAPTEEDEEGGSGSGPAVAFGGASLTVSPAALAGLAGCDGRNGDSAPLPALRCTSPMLVRDQTTEYIGAQPSMGSPLSPAGASTAKGSPTHAAPRPLAVRYLLEEDDDSPHHDPAEGGEEGRTMGQPAHTVEGGGADDGGSGRNANATSPSRTGGDGGGALFGDQRSPSHYRFSTSQSPRPQTHSRGADGRPLSSSGGPSPYVIMSEDEFCAMHGCEHAPWLRYLKYDTLQEIIQHLRLSAEEQVLSRKDLVRQRKALYSFLKGMLQVDPRRRMTVGQLLEHPFITQRYPPTAPSASSAAGGGGGSVKTATTPTFGSQSASNSAERGSSI